MRKTPRRSLCASIIRQLLALTVAVLALASPASRLQAAERPNVVWILSEDNSIHWLRLYGYEHGVAPNIEQLAADGVTFEHALQTTVLSLPALRRLKFLRGTDGQALADRAAAQLAARTALAALALAAVAGAHGKGHDLRSGALLVGDGPLTLEVLEADGRVSGSFTLTPTAAAALLAEAAGAASVAGMGWNRSPLDSLRPADKLVKLLAKSQGLASNKPAQADEEA